MIDEKPRYKWPKYVLAGVILFLVASVVWMVFETARVKQERDFSAPIQAH